MNSLLEPGDSDEKLISFCTLYLKVHGKKYIGRNYNTFPEDWKKYLSDYQFCYEHWTSSYGCQFDGFPPQKIDCKVCLSGGGGNRVKWQDSFDRIQR